MRMWILWVVLSAVLSGGCSPATVEGPVAGMQGVASLLASVGSTAAGFKKAQSAIALNGANQRLIDAQAAMTRAQVEQTRDNHSRLNNERKVTARLLRVMSTEYHEPLFETLAEWVEAGGDPDFAFKYALSRADEEQTVQAQSHQTLSLTPRPELSPAVSLGNAPQHHRLVIGKAVSEPRAASVQDQPRPLTNSGE